jgi:hypothetical protein
VVAADLQLGLQLVETHHLAVTRGGPRDSLDLAGSVVGELGPEDVIRRHDSLQGGLHDLDRRRREHEEIEVVSIDAAIEDPVKQLDVLFQGNAFAGGQQVLTANPAAELRIVQQQIGELRSLLNQAQLGHAAGLAVEFLYRDIQQLAEHKTRIVEAQRLVEVTGKKIAFKKFVAHSEIRFQIAVERLQN